MIKTQKGFTLIELVVVIAILGILSAIAIPRFISVQRDARVAVVDGMVGAINSAVVITRTQYKLSGDNGATVVTLDGQLVLVNANTGVPTGELAGIGSALQSTAGYLANYDTPAAVTFTPSSYTGIGDCKAIYNGLTGSVSSDVTDC